MPKLSIEWLLVQTSFGPSGKNFFLVVARKIPIDSTELMESKEVAPESTDAKADASEVGSEVGVGCCLDAQEPLMAAVGEGEEVVHGGQNWEFTGTDVMLRDIALVACIAERVGGATEAMMVTLAVPERD